MSTLLPLHGAAPAAAPAARRLPVHLSVVAVLTIAFVLIIIYAELLTLFVAAVWSASGALGLGFAGLVGLSVFLVPLTAWGAWRVTAMVISTERLRAIPAETAP
jgi:hypothetical protein